MIYYITFNDVPSGIYQSQVIDVISYLKSLNSKEIKLIAFLPLQNFKRNKQEIKKHYGNSVVIPVVAGISRWRLNKHVLKWLTKKSAMAICRGPLAASLALYRNFDKIVYDGRAAVKPEVEEYNVTGNDQLGKDFIEAEKEAVLKADYRIAVSEKLIDFWKSEFDYQGNDHVVIPCTLTSKTIGFEGVAQEHKGIRLVYSGGIGPWQSFDLVVNLLEDLLDRQKDISVLFLTKECDAILNLIKKHPNRCERKWLKHDEVNAELAKCDYGILIRDQKITNKVASPVKFAEYLNAGLKVLISENLGDFTDFVRKNDCGEVVVGEIEELKQVSGIEKKRINQLARAQFSKSSEGIKELYLSLLTNL